MNILITDTIDPLFIELLKKNKINYDYKNVDNRLSILKIIHEFDGLVVRNRLKIDGDFLKHAKHLKFIARYGLEWNQLMLKKPKSIILFALILLREIVILSLNTH